MEITTDLGWTILVLIPKVNTNTQGIGLLKTLCKVVESIINILLKAYITFRDVLHGLFVVRGTGRPYLISNLLMSWPASIKTHSFSCF